MTATVVLMTALLASAQVQELPASVTHYWLLLEQRAKAEAMAYVEPSTHAVFLARVEPPFQAPQLKAIRPIAEDRAEVEVVVKRLIGGGYFNWRIVEEWQLSEGAWKVVVRDAGQNRREFWTGSAKAEPDPGTVDVVPGQVRLHFLSREQKASLVFRNGSALAVAAALTTSVPGLGVTPDRVALAPGESVVITVSFSGESSAKNQVGRVAISWTRDLPGAPQSVEVLYNYVSDGARALLGLDKDKLKELEPGRPLPAVIPPRSL